MYREQYQMFYTVPEGFAGSILNLEPATSYECEFTQASRLRGCFAVDRLVSALSSSGIMVTAMCRVISS